MTIKHKHADVYDDWCYLWNICPAADMTGAYVDQTDLAKLLKTPNKATAVKCLINQIDYWFESGTEDGGITQVIELLETDCRVKAIYRKYC